MPMSAASRPSAGQRTAFAGSASRRSIACAHFAARWCKSARSAVEAGAGKAERHAFARISRLDRGEQLGAGAVCERRPRDEQRAEAERIAAERRLRQRSLREKFQRQASSASGSAPASPRKSARPASGPERAASAADPSSAAARAPPAAKTRAAARTAGGPASARDQARPRVARARPSCRPPPARRARIAHRSRRPARGHRQGLDDRQPTERICRLRKRHAMRSFRPAGARKERPKARDR